MSLSAAMKTAQSSFSNVGLQSAVTSKNIANASNPNYARRAAILATATSGATVVETQRAQNEALLKQNLLSISKSSGQDTLLAGLTQMKMMMGGEDYEIAPSTYLAKLRDNLQTFADKPSEISLAETVVSDAIDVANSLNSTSNALQKLRAEADADIDTAVTELNRLLSEFKTYNDKVRLGTAAGTDVNDALDQRDKLLTEISGIVGVTAVNRTHNDLALYTSDGTVLFETVPRTVSFQPTTTFTAAVDGNQVLIDGVPVQAGAGGNTSAQGTIAALLQIRDYVAPTFQKQLDEVARGVIEVFSEGGVEGLFISNGLPAVTDPGLAAVIRVNPDVISSEGGSPTKLRDGINAVYNTGNNASFSDLLNGYTSAFEAPMSFDPDASIETTTTLLSFSTSSVGWLEEIRRAATTAGDDKAALLGRTQEALLNVTAVSLDEELALLLDLEQSYKASAKLVAAVDEMIAALLQAAG
ncbi:flagellar hook-associated protein FlgK [Shinella yambaruensis]|uniref:Flagellar hook-associated protein 1 n=1 Tax=Shinella yambaruensis TaxID=415996 RepID=A0ABQ5ZHF8_9HYPH|nr:MULTISPECIES: flagellar hook-associated protein FlgK [Shinella]CAI0340944.1 Flagellar hook-associated protein flgK [Rhizobiaceae bacterium]CAK7259288.1 flagellar hook-associated protein 1 FlgK [Shinella sp. WSC3-e]MCJ8026143.1 flagellar hook-associated protein FlgK [Shinella yambaruensis]MCO5136870.1 flagellar hook-associated protein FlgK [Shinella sp.]MCU7978135.1 flagellar hook-associated protein FlgK [Shinella yambaruensis]